MALTGRRQARGLWSIGLRAERGTMALAPCTQCGNLNATDAKTCPRCGASLRRTSLAAKLFLGFLALVFIGEVRNVVPGDRGALPAVQAAMAPAPTQEASPAVPPEPEPPSARGSVASFTKGGLVDECTDLMLTFRMGVDAGPDTLDKMFSAREKQRPSRLQRPCAEQFRDRAPLARCTIENDIAAKRPDAGMT